MINTNVNSDTNANKLEFFDFDLAHFVEIHLDTAIKYIQHLESLEEEPDYSNYQKFAEITCQMGFVDRGGSICHYSHNLQLMEFSIKPKLDHAYHFLAVKPTMTYTFHNCSYEKIARILLNKYKKWLVQRINEMNLAVTNNNYVYLIQSTIAPDTDPRIDESLAEHKYVDDIFTRQSLLKLIANNLDKFSINIADSNSHLKDYYLPYLLKDYELRQYFITLLLTKSNFTTLIIHDNRVASLTLLLIKYIINDISIANDAVRPIYLAFIHKALLAIADLPNAILTSELNEHLSTLFNAERLIKHNYISYPIATINKLVSDKHDSVINNNNFIIVDKADLSKLLNDNLINAEYDYSEKLTNGIIKTLNRIQLTFTQREWNIVVNYLSTIKEKEKMTPAHLYKCQLLILNKLISLMQK